MLMAIPIRMEPDSASLFESNKQSNTSHSNKQNNGELHRTRENSPWLKLQWGWGISIQTTLQSHLNAVAGGFSWQLLLTVSLYQLLKTGTLCTRVQHSSWCTSYWTTWLKEPPLEEICCCSEKISRLTCEEPWPSTLPANRFMEQDANQDTAAGTDTAHRVNEIQGKLWALLVLTFSLTGLLPLLHKKYLPGKIQRHRSLSKLCPNTPSFSALPKQSSLAKNTVL